MAAVDIYLNETTRHADVVAAPTTALEREQYDLVFHTLAVRNTARFTPPALEKAGGAMHDWEIFREIALRTGARLKRKKTMAKALAERVSLNLSPTTILSTLLLTGRRTTMRALRAKPAGVDLGRYCRRFRAAADRTILSTLRLSRGPQVASTIAESSNTPPDGEGNGDLVLIAGGTKGQPLLDAQH